MGKEQNGQNEKKTKFNNYIEKIYGTIEILNLN